MSTRRPAGKPRRAGRAYPWCAYCRFRYPRDEMRVCRTDAGEWVIMCEDCAATLREKRAGVEPQDAA